MAAETITFSLGIKKLNTSENSIKKNLDLMSLGIKKSDSFPVSMKKLYTNNLSIIKFTLINLGLE